MRERVSAFDFSVAERVNAPRVEIQFEFDGDHQSLEVEDFYPAGAVPEDLVNFQKMFFEDIFE
mgnify:CR=1 FL=1